jgi:hypothetical protein
VAYRAFHHSRRFVPLRLLVRVVGLLAAILPAKLERGPSSVEVIARAVCATEQSVGFSDCYPRAVLTAFLASAMGHHCTITVGTIAPTRKMHAWCSIDGVLPFEPSAEHYLYQPVWAIEIT